MTVSKTTCFSCVPLIVYLVIFSLYNCNALFKLGFNFNELLKFDIAVLASQSCMF